MRWEGLGVEKAKDCRRTELVEGSGAEDLGCVSCAGVARDQQIGHSLSIEVFHRKGSRAQELNIQASPWSRTEGPVFLTTYLEGQGAYSAGS